MVGIRFLGQQSLTLQNCERLRHRPAGDAEILRNGDWQVTVPIGPHKVVQDLYVDRQQPMPCRIVTNRLLNERPEALEQKDSLAHGRNVSPRYTS